MLVSQSPRNRVYAKVHGMRQVRSGASNKATQTKENGKEEKREKVSELEDNYCNYCGYYMSVYVYSGICHYYLLCVMTYGT